VHLKLLSFLANSIDIIFNKIIQRKERKIMNSLKIIAISSLLAICSSVSGCTDMIKLKTWVSIGGSLGLSCEGNYVFNQSASCTDPAKYTGE
jgi:hypothetical protein